jgi:hypothetical protein
VATHSGPVSYPTVVVLVLSRNGDAFQWSYLDRSLGNRMVTGDVERSDAVWSFHLAAPRCRRIDGMGGGTTGDPEVVAESPVLWWIDQVDPYVQSLLCAASAASRMGSTGVSDADTRAVASVRSAASSLRYWTDANPCPDRALAARFGFVLLAMDRSLDDASVHAAFDRLKILDADLQAFSQRSLGITMNE